MENIIKLIYDLIMQNQILVTTIIGVVITALVTLIIKKAPNLQQSALISGLSKYAVEIILMIFKSTQYNHVEYNESLKKPAPIFNVKSESEQKMIVAVQAMKEKLPNSTLKKAGDLFDFAQMTYKILKPLFKKRK